jgi:mono/diheme cytochrome c family protein
VTKWLIFVAICIATSAAVGGCKVQQSWTEPDPGLERMMQQPRVDPFQESAFFDDGLAMRKPPNGTVSIERRTGDRSIVEGVVDGRYAAAVPVPLTRALLDRGRDRFERICAVCHGVDGSGESVVAQNMALRRPPSLHEARIVALPVGRLYQVIGTGYGLMPSYAAMLPIDDRWAVVAYVRALQISRRIDVSRFPELRAEIDGRVEEQAP